ncbi:box C/D snoRNA protein 1-like isoform X2 [Acropora millepora]|uniref:box C/D snoRNA protein 1-like isoform X2 n=1 Tax=Acropora millepora TaxID=45264 RepID=UPI0010FCCBD2|nr:box C/D snoRNA protein 1-like isoform X2 [Acropora millepora]
MQCRIFFISLACVKCHKKQFLCSGARCKTKFISVGNFTDRDFLSDYRFLEDVDRLAFTASHDSQRSWKRWGPEAFLLRRKAKESGVKLKLMPVGMSKRKENSSKFDKASKCVMWRVRWLFPQAGMEYVDNRISELTIMRDALMKYIDSKKADPVHKQSLKNYNAIGVQGMSVFLRVEPLPASKLRFYQLDISRSIKECLAGKLIVEFPTFHVVLPSKVASYPTMDHKETCDNNAGSVNGEEKEFSVASIPMKEKCAEACQDECT